MVGNGSDTALNFRINFFETDRSPPAFYLCERNHPLPEPTFLFPDRKDLYFLLSRRDWKVIEFPLCHNVVLPAVATGLDEFQQPARHDADKKNALDRIFAQRGLTSIPGDFNLCAIFWNRPPSPQAIRTRPRSFHCLFRSRDVRSRMFFRIGLLSQAGVRGDPAAFFQPSSLKRKFVLMFFPAIFNPP
jgi:hypothetical protein